MQLAIREFEGWAEQQPAACALIYGEERCSYAELNGQANRLAHYLRELGLAPGQPVAVMLTPGFSISVAMLAIFKARAVYVPLDPDYPRARLDIILSEVAPAFIVTHSLLQPRLQGTLAPLLALDSLAPQLALMPSDNLQLPQFPDDRAYIFFTSGTTGTPKGVVASQGNLVHYLGSAREHYGFGPGDSIPAVARFTFSISLFELLMPLVSGGSVLLLDRDHILDPARLCQSLQSVTFFHIGPSLLHSLVAYIRQYVGDMSVFAGVRHASSGGDMIAPELLQELRTIFCRAEVYVIYGCSEISCMGCTYLVPAQGAITKTYVGKPFAGVQLRLLDAEGRAVAPGEVGDIVLGGAGVVQGYLNRPALSAEKFTIDAGERYYATGDLGRLSPDGQLEMLGRTDFQVQVRGMRVELAEVEFTLRRTPGVKEAVVMAKPVMRDSQAQDLILVAYCVFDAGYPADVPALKRQAIDNLPEYMVPSRYLVLDALPLNHNLKVDRLALPHPDDLPPNPTTVVSAGENPPLTDTEKNLALIWQRLLRVDAVQRSDNFFDLGGYSLLGIDCVLAVQTQLQVKIDGMDLLRENLAMLAALVDKQRGLAQPVPAPQQAVRPYHIDTFYFGQQQRLYGAYWPAAEPTQPAAVLICPAFGSEWIRAHFVMRKVVQRLVDAGYPVMRFDFWGIGDSLGDAAQVRVSDWAADVQMAADELRRRSGCQQIIGVGVRWGGSLLCRYAAEAGIARQVLWDPIASGQYHLTRMRRSQALLRQYNRALFPWWYRQPKVAGEELLGIHYSAEVIAALHHFSLADYLHPQVSVIDASGDAAIAEYWQPLAQQQRIASYAQPGLVADWWKPAGLETLWPDRGVSQAIIDEVQL